jgi:hypothetical protein
VSIDVIDIGTEDTGRLSMLSLLRDNQERFVALARSLGCPYSRFGPRMVAWLQNRVSGGRGKLQSFNEDFEFDQRRFDAAKAALIESKWATGRQLPPGTYDHLVGMWGTRLGGEYVANVMCGVLSNAQTPHTLGWVLASDRTLDARDDKMGPLRDTFRPETLSELSDLQIPLTNEWAMAVATLRDKGFAIREVARDSDDSIKHVLMLGYDTPVHVVFVPGNGKPVSATTAQKHLIANYGDSFHDGQRVTYAVVRLGQRAAAAIAMEMAQLRPDLRTDAVWAEIADEELDNFIMQFVNEVINTMAKALQEIINTQRVKAGLRPIDSNTLRELLDLLHQRSTPDEPVVDDEFMESACTDVDPRPPSLPQ